MDKTTLTVFDAKKYEKRHMEAHRPSDIEALYLETHLNASSLGLIRGPGPVSVFVNDRVDRRVLTRMKDQGVDLVALRCAGFNNVDLECAREFGISVTRVPAYSPHAVAEHALALMMTLNRKTHRAYNRVREGNFYLNRLEGFDMFGKTAGVIGTGKIGLAMIRILRGLGMEVLAFDKFPAPARADEYGFQYVELDRLLAESVVISLHAPLSDDTHHIIDANAISKMRPGCMIINTSRGGLIDSQALIQGLKSGQVGAAGLDVYESEANYFFADHSGELIDDELLIRLISFPNVLITSHQGFLTDDALDNIAESVMASLQEYRAGKRGAELTNYVGPES